MLKKKTICKVGCSHFASTQARNKTYRQIQCTSVSELSNRFYFVFSRFHCNTTPPFGHQSLIIPDLIFYHVLHCCITSSKLSNEILNEFLVIFLMRNQIFSFFLWVGREEEEDQRNKDTKSFFYFRVIYFELTMYHFLNVCF